MTASSSLASARPLVAVACSGGRDSAALLHATLRAARAQGGGGVAVEVLALHVHHGLQAAAEDWLRQVQAQARRWGAAFDSRRLTGKPASGQSVEAWARAARYQALAEMAHVAGCGLVLLAHHRRDQAETWLLQALRGGSMAGLSAMPGESRREGIVWARPWLRQPREAIEAYVARHRIGYVDDDSNVDPRFARNRLRLQVWPALTQAFPAAEAVLADATAQAQQAARLAAEVLAGDLPDVVGADGSLQVPAWLQLTPARRHNVLRGWLAARLQRAAPHALLERLVDELARSRAGRWPAPDAEIRLHRGALRCVAMSVSAKRGCAEPASPPPSVLHLRLDQPGDYPIAAWRGTLRVSRGDGDGDGGGAAPAALGDVELRPRSGGERFMLAPKAIARSLKKQYQACAVAAWQRGGPLIFAAAGRLIFVPGLGIDARMRCAAGEQGLHITWLPDHAQAQELRQSGS